jgi:hypothetical protein
LRLVALAAVGTVLLAASRSGAAPRADAVTLSMRQYIDATKRLIYVWYGQTATSAAGEDVELLGRDCLTTNFHLLTATKTVAGGGYEVDSTSSNPFNPGVIVNSGTAFRARWRDEMSAPLLWRLPLYGIPKKVSRTKWKVVVNPAPVYMVLTGRVVVVQRYRSGKWVRYKQARLIRKANYDYGGSTNHEAVFEVPQRGLRLRILIPAKTAAPCFRASTGTPWRS